MEFKSSLLPPQELAWARAGVEVLRHAACGGQSPVLRLSPCSARSLLKSSIRVSNAVNLQTACQAFGVAPLPCAIYGPPSGPLCRLGRGTPTRDSLRTRHLVLEKGPLAGVEQASFAPGGISDGVAWGQGKEMPTSFPGATSESRERGI